MHDTPADDLCLGEPHLVHHLQGGRFGERRRLGDEHRHAHDAVTGPLHLRSQQPLGLLGERRFEPPLGIVLLVQFVDVLNLGSIAQRAACVSEACLLGAPRVHVVAEVTAYRSAVVGFPRDDAVCGNAAVGIAGDTVSGALRKFTRIHELACGDRGKVAALVENFLEKQHRAFLQLAHPCGQLTLALDLDHAHESVDSHQRLPGRVHPGDVVVVPGNVAAFIGGDGALDMRRGHARQQRVHDVGNGRLAGIGLHVARVLLGAENIAVEQIAQGDGVRQVESQLGRRRRGWRHG